MKTDLDRLMLENDIDAILVVGPAQHNPAMYYLTGGGHLTKAMYIQKRGEAPRLFHQSMERDEAASTGLATKNLDDYRFNELLENASGDVLLASAARYKQMLIDCGITKGRMVIYGLSDAGAAYSLFSILDRELPELTLFGELDDSILLAAMATKDLQEVERIRSMGKITTEVVGRVADFLVSHSVRDEVLVKSDGTPVRIGDVKSHINLWLAELGAENPEGTIFAIGRDAGVPHSTGKSDDMLRTGQTIIFDIFPCEMGGGYFYDFTRTWCLGYAPDAVLQLYEDVFDVYNLIMSELTIDTACKPYQERTCDLFEKKGHATIKSNPQTQEGYVHSLGHGVGLHVHERPWFGISATEDDRLTAGSVVTIEPGLYYPDKGMGIRIEDTVLVRPDGVMEILSNYPYDLILQVK